MEIETGYEKSHRQQVITNIKSDQLSSTALKKIIEVESKRSRTLAERRQLARKTTFIYG